jgi:hypothetical protein
MDPMQLIAEALKGLGLGPKGPAPAPAGAPSSNLPVFPATPPVDPRNPYDSTPRFNLGKTPLPVKPIAPVHMGTPSWNSLSADLANAFPEMKPLAIPDYTPRADPHFADLTPFVESMKKNVQPIDHRLSEKEAWDKKLQRGWAGAAAGAKGTDSFGDAALGASSGFFGAQGEFDDQQRQETIAFEEDQRAANAEIAKLEMEVEQHKADIANAKDDNSFFNSQGELAVKMQRLEDERNTMVANAAAWQQRLGLKIDMQQGSMTADYNNRLMDRDYQEKLQAWEAANAFAQSGAKEILSQSDDGNFITFKRRDPTTGEEWISTEATTPGAQIARTTQGLVDTGMPQAEATDTVRYQTLAQYHPDQLKQELIMKLLREGKGKNIFEPTDAGLNRWIFPLNSADYVTDLFSESPYEKAANEAAQIVGQRQYGDETQRQEALMEETAARLVPLLNGENLARARQLSKGQSSTQKGLDFVK